MILVELTNRQSRLRIDETRLRDAIRTVLLGEGLADGQVSVAVVDGPEMHELNRRHLAHDFPTDVLSFVLERDGETLDGEIVVSADEAILNAPEYGWPPEAELTLYAIHGALHLCGYDDLDAASAEVMRARERHWLAQEGLPRAGRDAAGPLVETQPGVAENRP